MRLAPPCCLSSVPCPEFCPEGSPVATGWMSEVHVELLQADSLQMQRFVSALLHGSKDGLWICVFGNHFVMHASCSIANVHRLPTGIDVLSILCAYFIRETQVQRTQNIVHKSFLQTRRTTV